MHFDFLDRFGIPLGISTIASSALVRWLGNHGMDALSGFGMAIGITCTLITTSIKVSDWWDRKRAKARFDAEARVK
jgi:hypothetical protein